MRNVDTTPSNPDQKLVAFWRIRSGRIVAALFAGKRMNHFTYRLDNGGGWLVVPNVDIILQNAEDAAIRTMDQRVAESYPSAKRIDGPPGYVSM